MKIVFLDSAIFNDDNLTWQPITKFGDITIYDRTQPSDIIARSQEADILIVNKCHIGEGELNQLPKLKLILIAATGYDNIDIAAAARHNVTVCNVPGYGTLTVAQHAFALLLEQCNQVGSYTTQIIDNKTWQNSPDFCYYNRSIIELAGKRVAIVGLGNIGTKVAQLLQILDAEVVAVTSKSQDQLPLGIKKVSIEEAFSTSFAVSLHCPLNKDNAQFINSDLLSKTRRGLILINTARGGLISEDAVAEALRSGVLSAYCCDVLSKEPPAPDNPILSAPHVFITPHIAWASADARQRIINIMGQNIADFLAGEPHNAV